MATRSHRGSSVTAQALQPRIPARKGAAETSRTGPTKTNPMQLLYPTCSFCPSGSVETPGSAAQIQQPAAALLDRNLALELVRVTEAAALSAAESVGRGDTNAVDGAAVRGMRSMIGTVSMRGVVVIGEGEKDAAPMLYNGEHVGVGIGPTL